jgi:NAD(P)-dependent dehydrogenase (short-subunit alcohol dehydrogenase family)
MGITKAAVLDCAKFRVHVNALCPGCMYIFFFFSFLFFFILTRLVQLLIQRADTDTAFIADLTTEQRAVVERMHPFRGLGQPEDIANAALFLVSEENTWVSGVGLAVDGGYTAI